MSTAENKLLICRCIEEVVNTGNVDDLASFISPNYIESHDQTGQSSGLEGAKKHILGVRQTYPDLHVTVEQQIPWALRKMGPVGCSPFSLSTRATAWAGSQMRLTYFRLLLRPRYKSSTSHSRRCLM